MEANQGIERVYELLEQFDFTELPEQDKRCVLSLMTEIEYINLRGTLKDTGNFLTDAEELTPDKSIYRSLATKMGNRNSFLVLLKKPVQIYKAAASVLIIVGIYTVIQLTTFQSSNSALALNDTIYIQRTDTVYSKLVDTVRIIKEKIIYASHEKDKPKPVRLTSSSGNEFDTSREICPEDVDKIKALAFDSNISRDTLFRD